MHDPYTQAFEIKNPFAKKDKGGYRPPLITIWHVDPEIGGSDDSCGWFKRSHHGDKKVLEKIKREFAFEFKHNYWFDKEGYPKFSAIGTVLNMYQKACYQVFGNWKATKKFMKKHLYDLMIFAENPTDSLRESIYMTYGNEKEEYRIEHFASIIYGDILRRNLKWYQHPRWHIHHWKINFHPFLQLKRRYWEKCSVCGKRGFKGSAYSDWNGTKIWHDECNNTINKPITSTTQP